METIKIDILNPKAKSLLKNMAELDLIRIRKEKVRQEFKELLEEFRMNADEAPNDEEIAAEVEAVRKLRNEK